MKQKGNAMLKRAGLFILTFALPCLLPAQICPPNIDFEAGSFSNWTCQTGYVYANGNTNEIVLTSSGGPIGNRHTIFSRANASTIRDLYGDFPVVCPNGSGYSILLGNTRGGHEADGVSYEFTIPANQNRYNLIYNYAVVFQNPNHQIYEQPRFEIEIKNVTDNQLIDCASFTFIPFGSSLPGFFTSAIADSIMCKDWTPVSINLDGKAGKTIRLTFKTADCTFNRHFGYAYVDVNTGCSGVLTGAEYCQDDTAVNLVGPFGFMEYKWYNQSQTTLLGTSQNLTLRPPPPPGTVVAVQLTPYNGYGCVETVFSTLNPTLQLTANAGNDTLLCNGATTILGEPPKPGVIYQWLPPTGLSDSSISNPFAAPTVTTNYVLNIRNSGGGCRNADTVLVRSSLIDSAMAFRGKLEYCITSSDSAVFEVRPGYINKWFRNGRQLDNQFRNVLRAPGSGQYYAQLQNSEGCVIDTRKETVFIETPRPGIRYPLVYSVVNIETPLSARDFGGTFNWQPNRYLNNYTIAKPILKSPIDTKFDYTIFIVSKAGCATADTQMVDILKKVDIFVPDAFTPNNDELNDYHRPIPYGATIKIFKIFNRLGMEVFSLEQNKRGWDGRRNGIPMESGVYVWYLEADGLDKKTYQLKGQVTLIR
jgi:gliding motility-associated-like protein